MMLAPGRVAPLGLDAPALSTHRSPLDSGGGASRLAGRSVGDRWRTACRRGGGGSDSAAPPLPPSPAARLLLPAAKTNSSWVHGAKPAAPGFVLFFFPSLVRFVPRPGYNRCATAVRSLFKIRIKNFFKKIPGERREPRSDQRARSRAAAVTRRVSPGGGGRVLPAEPLGRPIGARSVRGGITITIITIITYLPLISASVPIQPSVLPAARLSRAPPLETEAR